MSSDGGGGGGGGGGGTSLTAALRAPLRRIDTRHLAICVFFSGGAFCGGLATAMVPVLMFVLVLVSKTFPRKSDKNFDVSFSSAFFGLSRFRVSAMGV
jgi:hypothetical protein